MIRGAAANIRTTLAKPARQDPPAIADYADAHSLSFQAPSI